MVLTWLRERYGHPEIENALRDLEKEVPRYDPWGFSPRDSKPFAVLASLVYRYFRPVVTGIEHLPAGRVLVVANHSGQLPFDGLVIGTACLLKADPPRMCRPMMERWVPTLPFVNVAFSRAGGVVGDPINCRNLLERENAILVFPEGTQGSGKTWFQRYRLTPFGRGFMRLALQTKTPIVLVSVVGAEEAIISVANLKPIANLFGMPYLPVPLLLPVLGPLSIFPLPTRFYLDFAAPLHFDGPFDDEDEVIDAKVDTVRTKLQAMIDERLSKRESVF